MKSRYNIPFRRKLEGKTDYRKRLKLLSSGSRRLVIRKSLKNMTAQVIEFAPEGDKVLLSASSRELIKMGWTAPRSNVPAAYLVGLLLASKAKAGKVSGRIIVDIGLATSVRGSRLYALVRGAIDGGLGIECSKDILPDDDRVSGKHISEYSDKRQFKYDAAKLPELFDKVKKQIMGAR
ncbi:50S ribosomal protein L18 [Candidatus Woesearchaeota archaeon]|nr:50S ribosomal protein L18 [Candidatus Woesearchaeota archaeon]